MADPDDVLGFKENQSKLPVAVVDYVAGHMENDIANVKARRCVTHDKGHGREETRTDIQLSAPHSLPGFDNGVRNQFVAHAGDSRCYLFSKGKLHQEIILIA